MYISGNLCDIRMLGTVEWIAFGNRVMCSSSKSFPILIQRYEKKYGKDESNAVPRCIMAAKFISSMDMTGESTLQHWIKQGQIQDLHQVFRIEMYLRTYRLKDPTALPTSSF